MKQPLQLNEDFNYALDVLEKTNQNIFITGRAGTGKSTLLQLFRSTTRKKIVVLAPTGIAALNVGGQTIHSFFGFPPRLLQPEDIKKRRNRHLYQRLDLIVIDEISMVRADLLDNIDRFLKVNRENQMPFGGVQMVFIGDLFQLPPVVARDAEFLMLQLSYSSPYFFSAAVLEKGFEMEVIELRKVYRQNNRRFLRLLEAIRLNQADRDDLEELNERYQPHFQNESFYITLTARNATADRINKQELNALSGRARFYQARISGTFKPSLYPTEAILSLKPEAQVMFIKNDPDKRFVNGTIGKIVNLGEESVTVLLDEQSGKEETVEVGPMEWEIIRYKSSPGQSDRMETETVGSFTQLPLRLAWAVTIHKAQGKTFDRVIIDLGKGAFEHGQTYVALSRCRSLEGIILQQPLRPRDIQTDPKVVEFYSTFR